MRGSPMATTRSTSMVWNMSTARTGRPPPISWRTSASVPPGTEPPSRQCNVVTPLAAAFSATDRYN